MARKASLSGFPEYLPAERLVENHVLDTLRETFELHGFSPIETRSVETIEQLLRKGEIDKEVYAISRLQEDDSAKAKEKLALHFDLTVPFARYVVENAGYLNFPFSRYQIQKVWRGERPQEGRAREFTQADIDVVGDGELPFRYDVTLALVVVDALSKLPIPDFKLRVNNRKLAEGFYPGPGPDRHRGRAALHRQAGEDWSRACGRGASVRGRCERGGCRGRPGAGPDPYRGCILRGAGACTCG